MEFHVMIQIKIRFLFFRNGISFKTISGEMSAVTEEMTASWNKTTLLSGYKLENVFNADKFGPPYQCLPTKTHRPPREKCPGGKNSRARLTSTTAANATGELIGKSKTPR